MRWDFLRLKRNGIDSAEDVARLEKKYAIDSGNSRSCSASPQGDVASSKSSPSASARHPGTTITVPTS